MRVMVMVKASKSSEAGEMPSEQLLREMGAYNEELVNAGIMLSGEGLHPSSNGKRVLFSGKSRTVMDGPFPETKELIAGFWIWRVSSMDEAIAWIKKCPNPMMEDSEIELRPVFESEDFGDEFTPELREQEAAIRAKTLGLEVVQFLDHSARRIAGLNRSYDAQTRMRIPSQWEEFAPMIGSVPGQRGNDSFGVCWNTNTDCRFDYLTGVEVGSTDPLPPTFTVVEVPPGRFAVFKHTGHVSAIPQTLETIWSKWVPDAGIPIGKGPCFERYTAEFDPRTGMGGTEIWIPVNTC